MYRGIKKRPIIQQPVVVKEERVELTNISSNSDKLPKILSIKAGTGDEKKKHTDPIHRLRKIAKISKTINLKQGAGHEQPTRNDEDELRETLSKLPIQLLRKLSEQV
jgi:hypothetical protein